MSNVLSIQGALKAKAQRSFWFEICLSDFMKPLLFKIDYSPGVVTPYLWDVETRSWRRTQNEASFDEVYAVATLDEVRRRLCELDDFEQADSLAPGARSLRAV